MFEKIFIYSPIDRKLNKISGVAWAIKMVLILFPIGGLGIGLFSCYVKYIPADRYRMLYYILYLLLMLIVVYGIVRWLRELFTVYAIGKDGKFYRFRMMAFAMGYLGFGRKVSEVAAKKTGKLAGTFELMMKVKQTIEGLEKEEQVEEMFAAGYLSEISDITVIREKDDYIKISAVCSEKKGDKKRKLTVRKVYDDWQNLSGYIKHMAAGESGEYKFVSRTSYRDFVGKKESYIRKVIKQSVVAIGITAWLGIFMLSGDISRESNIRAGKYTLTETNVDKNYELYTSVENPEHKIKIYDEKHINYKPLMAVFLICEVLIITINIDINSVMNKKSAGQKKVD